MAGNVNFELADWYPSEAAKRSFGRICQAVNEEGETITLMGTQQAPLLMLQDADECPELLGDVKLTIDEAKADWPAVTTAALVYGTRFRIQGKKVARAVLYRDPKARHPAEKYHRAASVDANRVAATLESLAAEVRKFGHKLAKFVPNYAAGEMRSVIERLEKSASIIDRRFAQLWRVSNGLPPDQVYDA